MLVIALGVELVLYVIHRAKCSVEEVSFGQR